MNTNTVDIAVGIHPLFIAAVTCFLGICGRVCLTCSMTISTESAVSGIDDQRNNRINANPAAHLVHGLLGLGLASATRDEGGQQYESKRVLHVRYPLK